MCWSEEKKKVPMVSCSSQMEQQLFQHIVERRKQSLLLANVIDCSKTEARFIE